MLTCRKASQLISYSLDHPLPWTKRIRLRFHVFACENCARFEKQARWLHTYTLRFFGHAPLPAAEGRLSADARARIEQALKDNS